MAHTELIEWLVKGGGTVHRHVKFQTAADGERGIFAGEPLPAGTELISVPHALCLHVPQPSPDTSAPVDGTSDTTAEQVRLHCLLTLLPMVRQVG